MDVSIHQSQEYLLFFLDPNYVLVATNPAIVPRSFVRTRKNMSHLFIYLKVFRLILGAKICNGMI